MKALLQESFELLFNGDLNTIETNSLRIEEIEDEIDKLTASYREKQVERLREGKLDATDCVIFSQVMTDIERVSDHIMNIMQEYRDVHVCLKTELFNVTE